MVFHCYFLLLFDVVRKFVVFLHFLLFFSGPGSCRILALEISTGAWLDCHWSRMGSMAIVWSSVECLADLCMTDRMTHLWMNDPWSGTRPQPLMKSARSCRHWGGKPDMTPRPWTIWKNIGMLCRDNNWPKLITTDEGWNRVTPVKPQRHMTRNILTEGKQIWQRNELNRIHQIMFEILRMYDRISTSLQPKANVVENDRVLKT